MILKIGNEYIDQDFDITVEKKTKLFDDIASVQGDFSYSSEMDNTAENRRILGIKSMTDLSKAIFTKVGSNIISDSGVTIYRGYVRVEKITNNKISFSFFSGNTDWIESLSLLKLKDIDWSAYDVAINNSVILSRVNNTEGVVFPLVNRGALSSRVSNTLTYNRLSKFIYVDDYQPFIYFKDIIKEIANASGIKISGDLFKDAVFAQTVTSNGGIDENLIKENSLNVNKSASQNYAVVTVPTAIEFDDDSSPYSNTIYDNWDTTNDDFSPEFDGLYSVKVNLRNTVRFYISLYVNNVQIEQTQTTSFDYSFTFQPVQLTPTDVVDVRAVPVVTMVPGSLILENSNVIIEPISINRIVVNNIVPDWTATKFLSNVFRMFNILPTYDNITKTITANFFRDIPKSNEIDLSEYLSSYEEDYVTIPSAYSKTNNLKYSQQSNDYITDYEFNNGEESYGTGALVIDNDFLAEESDLFKLDFVAPFQLDVPVLGLSLPFLDFVEAKATTNTRTITSISDASGAPQFNWSSGGEIPGSGALQSSFVLFRISNCTEPLYNGDYVSFTGTSTYIIPYDAAYIGSATGTLTVLQIFPMNNNDQVVLIHKPSRTYSQFSGVTFTWYESGGFANVITSNTLGYFYFPKRELTNKNIYKYALYFDRVNDDFADQVGLKEYCYSEIESILNDPAQVRGVFFLPESVFLQIDFLTKVRLKTKDFNSCFFVERITDYKESSNPCEIKLIKL